MPNDPNDPIFVELAEPSIEFGPDVRLIDASEPTRVQLAGDESVTFRLYREAVDFPVVARFAVEGEPTSKARARFTRNGYAYTPERTKLAERKVADAFKMARKLDKDEEATYGVMCVFFCGIRQRRDVDNMMKLILDGLNGIAWEDDSQVVELAGRKILTIPKNARSEIVIYQIGKLQYFTGTCRGCGSSFRVRQRVQSNGKRQEFCSSECFYSWKRNQNIRTCVACGSEFPAYTRKSVKYCSEECSPKKKRISLVCVRCGKSFHRYRSQVKSDKIYCSVACRVDDRRK